MHNYIGMRLNVNINDLALIIQQFTSKHSYATQRQRANAAMKNPDKQAKSGTMD
jgi:hypothetical protein